MMFGWCISGHHDQCIREFKKHYTDPKCKIVWTDEIIYCQCKKRGCPCFVPAKDRAKPKKKAVRKKK